MKPFAMVCLVSTVLISGCNSKHYLASGIAPATASGDVSRVENNGNKRGGVVKDARGFGYAYEAGDYAHGEGFAAFAGLLPGTELGELPTRGSATMTGRYEAAEIRNIKLNGNQLSGLNRTYDGDVTVTVDFASATLNGTSKDGRLQIDGDIHKGGSFSGNSSFKVGSGRTEGVIDGKEVIGAFSGASDTSLYAGGFTAKK